jgi:hypothetical protein
MPATGCPGETLLLVDIANRDGLVVLQTIWATTQDRRAGHRLTRFEDVANPTALMRRLAELTTALWPRREAAKRDELALTPFDRAHISGSSDDQART